MYYDFKLAEKSLEKEFDRINDIRDFNQRKVLEAFFDNKVAPEHFYTVSGYGHDDLGREVLDKNLNLVGKKRDKFLRQARALRANIQLRQKQQKERKKCITSK